MHLCPCRSWHGSCELCPCRLNAGLQVCPLNSPIACMHWKHMQPYTLTHTFAMQTITDVHRHTIAVSQLRRGTRHILISWCSEFMSSTWVVLSQIAYCCFAPIESGNVFLKRHFFVQDTYFCQHFCLQCTYFVGALQQILGSVCPNRALPLCARQKWRRLFNRCYSLQTMKTVKTPFYHSWTAPQRQCLIKMCRPQLARSTLAS